VSYLYFGVDYLEFLSPEAQVKLQDACVRLVDEVQGIHSPEDYRRDFRRLLDITACK
jgi:hypothetical protein